MDVTLEGSSTMIFTDKIFNTEKSLVLQKKKGIGSSHKFCYPSKFKIHPLLSHTLCLSNLEVGGVEIQETSYEGLVSDQQIVWPSPDDEIPFWKRDFPSWNVNPEVPNESSVKDSDLMHIIHVTAEMAPIAKVGGLGDVVTGLARASLSRGHTVDIVLPFYECIQKQQINDLALIKLALNGCRVTDTQPDIIHVHEWQIGALPLLYWDMYRYLSLKKPRIVLTIHNMEHYGECRQEQLSKCGLDGSMYATAEKAVDDRTIGHNPERLSLLKGGIVYSNAVVTVSPTYLKETLCSGWLASTLMMHCDKYFGVLNGIDTAMWNPATDVFLPAKFHAQKIEGKKLCKYYIQRGLGLAAKSITSSNHVPDATVKIPLGGQMIVLGKAPDGRVEGEFKHLADLHNQGPSIRILLMYSEELSHMLYAAADMVLVPSMYEPCGLSQIIGMRYGSVCM
ncbi:hypothetical protein OIU84_001079 [Salix udensis]|uniref:starch synthase n=1 Tax=Salix udensis TaxID=889485 RepID=A0AAD6PN25_9ROSI|nr:hypothetical protein OIU84_001079 [Salix udensis]